MVLSPNRADSFDALVPAPQPGGNIYAFFEVLDSAGNVAVETNKGTLAALFTFYMPIIGQGYRVAQ